jgi:hypothetical protein
MQKFSLDAMVRELLERARGGSGGRAAETVVGGHEKVLRQTVIALVAGSALGDHENPGEATVHVLAGRVRLAPETTSGTAGRAIFSWCPTPPTAWPPRRTRWSC